MVRFTAYELVRFTAYEYRADTSFEEADYEFRGSEEDGWSILRNGDEHLTLGPGYRLLRTDRCGVCSTDLDRHFLPFPLPQVTGHELVALDDDGRRYVVEINASHAALGVEHDCPFCTLGLSTHCPERLVLGIHDLPGGFGPWILAPRNAVHEIPDEVSSESAVLVEPFAATLRAVHVSAPQPGERVAVLGPRRLGMLLVAALAAERRRRAIDFEIHALVRREELGELALRFGADGFRVVTPEEDAADMDVIFDTTGNPDALALAARLARREVHIKSTHGRPSAGLGQLTAMVVDELAIARLPIENGEVPESFELENFSGRSALPHVAWLSPLPPPPGMDARFELARATRAADLRAVIATSPGLPRFDAVVCAPSGDAIDDVVRPSTEDEDSILRPRGTIWLDPRAEVAASEGAAVQAVVDRDLGFATSRCGDFRAALELLQNDAELRARVEALVTHRFDAPTLPRAFSVARSKECVKAIVSHDVVAK